MIEFRLTAHPSDLGFSGDYPREKLPKRAGAYWILLDPALADDRKLFFDLSEKGLDWTTNGHLSALAAFHPAWQDKAAKGVLEELAKAVQAHPPLVAAAAKAGVEVETATSALAQNLDPGQTASLFGKLRAARDASELAQAQSETLSRKIAVLKGQLQELIVKHNAERFRTTKQAADAAATAFNQEITGAYKKLWQALGPALEVLAESAPKGQVFPNRVYYASPLIPVSEGAFIKSFKKCAQIQVLKNSYSFQVADFEESVPTSKPRKEVKKS